MTGAAKTADKAPEKPAKVEKKSEPKPQDDTSPRGVVLPMPDDAPCPKCGRRGRPKGHD